MASTNQNFIKWRQDAFTIQFTITDAEVDLQDYLAYWAMSPVTASLAPSYVDANSPKVLIKTTTGDFSNETGISYQNYNKFLVTIKNSETNGFAPQNYYHELTLAVNDESSDGSDSVVVASGIFDLRFPLFPSNYR